MKKVTLENVLSVVNANIQSNEITVEQITDNLGDLGIDSIAFIQIIVALEEAFECEIPDSKLLITEMDTIQNIINTLESLYDESIG